MRRHWLVPVGILVFCTWPALVRAQAVLPPAPEIVPNLPTRIDTADHAVLLPPQTFDDTAKTPNHTREPQGQWTVSGGIYVMQPVFQSNPAFVVSGAGGNVSRQVDFGYHLDVAPQVWLGYMSERGWGVRGRWFEFDHDATENYITVPGESAKGLSFLPLGQTPVSGLVLSSSHLTVNVLDFQATYSCDSAKWSLLAACGIRYTHMSQDYRATLTGTNALLGTPTQVDLTSGHNLNGAGPSFSFEIKHRIGESGFALYGNLHGAVLFGAEREEYTAVNNGTAQEFTRSYTGVLPVGEMEIGAEYCRNMGRSKLFIQSGFTGQVWWGGGNGSNLDPIGPTSASSHNFGFVGLAVRAGVRY